MKEIKQRLLLVRQINVDKLFQSVKKKARGEIGEV